MRNQRQLGFDELMIVNPGSSQPNLMFLSEDGTLYQVDDVRKEQARQGSGQCFLGEDGFLYQVQGVDEEDVAELGHYFLGSDGGLYEIVQ